jgi:ubiquinone/menaquinone biosynthesis C-methylase UbiE
MKYMNRSGPANSIEEAAAKAFDKQSGVFDELYSSNTIIRYKRARVRKHVQQYLQPRSNILELNAGTGEDAVYFARHGHRVHATDIAPGMLDQLAEKVIRHGVSHAVSTELCSYTALADLRDKGPYDLIFSNFAGLNCTPDLDKVLSSFLPLLKPGGFATLVILPRFCLWELLLAVKGKFTTAFRRLLHPNGVQAHLEGQFFTCWYYNPSYITAAVKGMFNIIDLEGLCTIVPPSYLESFPEKYPRIYRMLQKKENRLKDKWPWKYIGDYYIISLQKI